MEVNRVSHMAGGIGNTSYATNSSYQKKGSMRLRHLIEEAILGLLSEGCSDRIITIADLGCSSGPNSLWVVSEIINFIESQCCRLDYRFPSVPFQYLVFLNDLERNDFNTIFNRFLPLFYEKFRTDKGEKFDPKCFVAVMQGSFYGRLFPSRSLHFIHSSYSLHWLSQIPIGLADEAGNPINKGNIYLGDGSPSKAFQAYQLQFQKDFFTFLKLRSEEIIVGGRMVLILVGRKSERIENKYGWIPLSRAIQKTVSQGFIEKLKLDAFNLPIYHPTVEELRKVIVEEGSFQLSKLETREDDECEANEINIAIIVKKIRAIVGPMLAAHFGEDVMDKIFNNCRNIPSECWEEDARNMIHIAVYLSGKKH